MRGITNIQGNQLAFSYWDVWLGIHLVGGFFFQRKAKHTFTMVGEVTLVLEYGVRASRYGLSLNHYVQTKTGANGARMGLQGKS